MATSISYGLNISSWAATLKRSFTLGRHSKNTFTPNSKNHALTDKVDSYKTATLGRFLEKENISEESALHLRNRTKALGRTSKGSSKVASTSLTALEQAKQLFANPEQENFKAENSKSSLQDTLISKASNKITRKLQKAKNSFQNESYKDAKKRFKKIIQKSYQARTTIELYLATIYLLQDNAYKAKKYLEGKPKRFTIGDTISLAQAMYSHVTYLINRKEAPEKIRGPCLIPQLYEKAEGFSEDETIMAKALYKKFCFR